MGDSKNKTNKKYAALVLMAAAPVIGGQAKAADQAPTAPVDSQPTTSQFYDPHKFSGPSALAYAASFDPGTGKKDIKFAEQIVLKDDGPRMVREVLASPDGCAKVSVREEDPAVYDPVTGHQLTRSENVRTYQATMCKIDDPTSKYGFDIAIPSGEISTTVEANPRPQKIYGVPQPSGTAPK